MPKKRGQRAVRKKKRRAKKVRQSARRPRITKNDQALRQHVVKLLDWRDAHIGFDQVIADWPAELRAAKRFAEADAVRDELSALGVTLTDSTEGTTWALGSQS